VVRTRCERGGLFLALSLFGGISLGVGMGKPGDLGGRAFVICGVT